MKNKIFAILTVCALALTSTMAGTDPLEAFPGRILQVAGIPSNGTSAVQTLTFGATITGGTFKLAYRGFTTSAITWSSTNNTLVANIDAALEALPSLAGGSSVTTAAGTITSGANGTVTITMTGNYQKLLVPAITVADNSMTGAAHTLTAAITTAGVTADGRSTSKGQLVIDTANGDLYINQGTSGLAPSWVAVPSQ